MNPYGCPNSIRDSEDIGDWTKGLCGENPGLLRLIVDAAYEWRAADVHEAACFLGERDGILLDARKNVVRKGDALRILLDRYQSELRAR